MPEPVNLLMLQFLDWVALKPRTYKGAMEAWRTSCPRLSVREDALLGGYIQVNGGEVVLTPEGKTILDQKQVRG